MEDPTESADHCKHAITYHNFFALETRQLFTGLRIATDIEDESGLLLMKTDKKEIQKIDDAALTISTKRICVTCGLDFEDRIDQVSHFHSDWHHFNLKRKINKGLSPVSKETFEEMADDVSSISGSDSTSDTDSEADDRTETLMKGAPELNQSLHRLPLVYFQNQEGELLSIYRCTLVDGKNDEADFVKLASRVHRADRWAVLMLGGGHFAGAVFQKCDVVVHKTFHRYTVRAKGGKAQGLCDQKGGCAKSAGSGLRRYNEAALIQDVQDLLLNWSDHIKLCNIIYIRAASYNKAILFAHKNPPFSKADDRIRRIPFPTRRPTMSEVKRVHKLLSSVSNYGQTQSLSDLLNSPRRKPEPKHDAVEKLVETDDKRPEENDQCSSSDGEIELTWMQETFSTNHLRDFEITKKPRRRKNKTSNEVKQTETLRGANEKIPNDVQKLQDQIYTACKTGNLQTFLNIATSTDPQSMPNEVAVLVRDGISSQENGSQNVQNYDLAMLGDGELLPDDSVPLLQIPGQILALRFGNREETMLHVTSRADAAELTYKLLEMGADPTLKDVSGMVPYAVCKSKLSRNEYRRFMAANPDRYDYTAAQVPAPLTEEMEAERKAREIDRKKHVKKAKKIRQKDQREKDLALEAEQREKERYLKLSDREKRALAAERRLLGQVETTGGVKPTLSRCFQCAEDITGKVPFEYYEFKFCTTKCLRLHRDSQKTGKSLFS